MKILIINLLYWTWSLTQTFLGLLFYLFFRYLKKSKAIIEFNSDYFTRVLIVDYFPLEAVSLGKFIICGKNKGYDENSSYMKELIKHEIGHTLQSFILGPLHLFIIEIPGFIWACFHNGKEDYFTFYTERWANKLGKVNENLL